MKILIAEDESDISFTYRTALESRNHNVLIANNGIQCIALYRKELSKRSGTSPKKEKGTKDVGSLSYPNPISQKKKNKNIHNPISEGTPNFSSPFDVVVLDYKMPGMDGLKVAKEILDLNPDQRIIFASAFVKETLEKSVKQLKRVVELLQKPFNIQAFIDTIEDKEVYEELRKLMVNIRTIDDRSTQSKDLESSSITREQIRDLFEGLRKIQKNRTF